MTQLGHVVFYVKQLERSVEFYRDLVGLEVQGKIFNDKAALLTGGSTHHELLLIEVGKAEGPLQGRRIGLYHVGWSLGDSIEQLKQAYDKAVEMGLDIQGMADHTISQSLYLLDPDGNEIELYVDNPDIDWHQDKSWMEAPVKPLSF